MALLYAVIMMQTLQLFFYRDMIAIIMKKIDTIIQNIISRSSGKSSFFVAIDGNGGAGKSTLAKHLKKALPQAKVIGMDFYYDPDLKRSDFLRVRDELIIPLKNKQRATSKIYDWPNKRFAEGSWVEPGGIFIIVSLSQESVQTRIRKGMAFS
ncbi:hypothetical protein HGA88_02910 [Candidatus Roizmanbacteria bacterium]|nr:hypothetical protein [Candidatus Roizmanbacteria bacterium]